MAKRIATAARVLDKPVEFFIADGQPAWAVIAWAEHQPGWPANFPPRPRFEDCIDKRREKRLQRLVDELSRAVVEEDS